MSHPAPSSSFNLAALPDFKPFREALRQAGFTAPNLSNTIAVQNPADGMDVPLVLLRTEEPTPYHSLTRLFVLGRGITEEAARAALSPMPLEPLFDCNLLERSEEGVRSTVKLVPYDHYFFVSDFSHKNRVDSFPADFVLGVGPASLSLASLTVRKSVATAFDLGAGAGVQSILAASHVKKIVGTDISSRALNFAAFNARLNDIENVEWRAGSFFEPVQPERFDLVMANPPFVISPESSLLYRDGGGQGDAVSEHVARGCAQRLNEGGFACMLINWHHKNDEDWSARPLQWCQDNGCDSWLVRFSETEPAIYAANWLRQTARPASADYEAQLGKWTGYFRQSGIGRISSGAVILRRRSGVKNWARSDSMQSAQAGGSCGEHIQRIFAAEDFLRSLQNDEEFLQQRLQPHPDLAIDQQLALNEGVWSIGRLTMTLNRGLPFPGNTDIQMLKLLINLNSSRTVGETMSLLAENSGVSVDSLRPACIAVLKKLTGCGMLVPAAAPG
jgi:methylase of polypeptide subunit release factors